MSDRKSVLRGWWLFVLLLFMSFAAVMIFCLDDETRPSVVRVARADTSLWALTRERTVLQGVEQGWWVSDDGGLSWSEADPPLGVLDTAPAEQSCNDAACYRLVDGSRIERQAEASSTWQPEHERDPEDAPPPNDRYRRELEAERSIAAVADGEGSDAVIVAAGREGVLRRDTDGAWRSAPVGRSWWFGIRWWLVGLGALAALVGGLVIDQAIRRFGPGRLFEPG